MNTETNVHQKKIDLTVKYTGHENFHEVVPGAETFHAVKLAAMHKFGIEASAAPKYVLQYDGVDVPENAHVSSLNQEKVELVLTLKKESEKG